MPNPYTQTIQNLTKDELIHLSLKAKELSPDYIKAVKDELQRRYGIINYDPPTSEELVEQIVREIRQKEIQRKSQYENQRLIAKHVLNVIKFVGFIILSLTILWLMYYLIGLLFVWLVKKSLIWLIIISLFGFSTVAGFGFQIFAVLALLLANLNPYKKVGKWIVALLAVILCGLFLLIFWGNANTDLSKVIIGGLVASGLTLYCTFAFCFGLFTASSDSNT